MTGNGANGYRVRQTDFSPEGYAAYQRERLAASPRTVPVFVAIETLCLLSGPPTAPEVADASGTHVSDARRLITAGVSAGLVEREHVKRDHVYPPTVLYGCRLTDAGRKFLTERETP